MTYDQVLQSVELREYPTDEDWAKVKLLALLTSGKTFRKCSTPSMKWMEDMVQARHSPLRYLRIMFVFHGIPSNTATHFTRHVHALPFVSSLRNDRQTALDGDAARRDTPVDMGFIINAEEFLTIMNKRLCGKAAKNTRMYAMAMKEKLCAVRPEFEAGCVPMCERCGGVCYEMIPCGKAKHWRIK